MSAYNESDNGNLAEGVGFEPTVPVRANQFSRLARYDRFGTPPNAAVDFTTLNDSMPGLLLE